MNELLKYIRNPIQSEDIQDVNESQNSILLKGYLELSKALTTKPVSQPPSNFKRLTVDEFIPGSIWLTKKRYTDFEGNDIEANIPYYVYLVGTESQLDDTTYVKVQPISPLTVFSGPGDVYVSNKEITGFDFIIETWNEQPITTNLLDKYIGHTTIEMPDQVADDVYQNMSSEQKEFRRLELENTKYLRNSILSYLSWGEKMQDDYGGVVFNFNNSPTYPPAHQISEPQSLYLAAAKVGASDKRQSFKYRQEIDNKPVSIEVIKNNDFHTIIVIADFDDLQLMNEDGKAMIINSSDPDNDLIVYRDLPSGLYILQEKHTDSSIRIRLV